MAFNQSILVYLAEHRSGFLTAIFQGITFMGGVEGYLIVIAFLYTVFKKRIAINASLVVLITMIANHLLKSIIQNPRPFTADGSYVEMWAVSASQAAELAAEFSTPSGHAMAAAAFYAYLLGQVRSTAARFTMTATIVLIGLSRPVLGVHYVEDILLGWVLGVGMAVLATSHVDRTWERWCSVSVSLHIAAVIALSVSVWLITWAVTGQQASALPIEFVGVLGFLSGVCVAAPIEASHVEYAPASQSLSVRLLSFVLMTAVLAGLVVAFDELTAQLDMKTTVFASVWRYLQYTLIGAVGVLLIPWLLVKMKWSKLPAVTS
ncbi:MAG: phosphatase PAP2 family protein [Pseudomonadota bacterium]